MEDGVNYYISVAVLAIALLVKLPALLRGWRSPLVRVVHALLLMPCGALLFSAPPTITFVNRTTGISNLSAVLVHCFLCGFSCACLVLMEYWRGDADAQARTRRRVRAWLLGYGLVVACVVGLFALGTTPVERPRDFDTYYANTPFIREMVVLYLLALVVAGIITMKACWRWAVDISSSDGNQDAPGKRTSLRAGLLVLVVVSLGGIVFGVSKLFAVLARWTGNDWDRLNEGVALAVSLIGVMIGLGFLVPMFGPRFAERIWRPLLALIALRPLWRIVSQPTTGTADPLLLDTRWYAGPEQRLLSQLTSIHDWMLRSHAHYSDDLRAAAHLRAKEDGEPEREAVAIGLAVMLRTAAADRVRKAPPTGDEQSTRAVLALRSAEAEYPDLIVHISRALPRVPDAHDIDIDVDAPDTFRSGASSSREATSA
ncbi:hypothetical protein [Streptomyces sp. NPDC059828]|uniref:hypothetical protein n=1 Tax=Streptomyces sp. NPDC059828 TaxID=3346965 RepID=UPI003666A7C5